MEREQCIVSVVRHTGYQWYNCVGQPNLVSYLQHTNAIPRLIEGHP